MLTRTFLLRVVTLAMTFVATAQGDTALAGHQIAWSLWFLVSMPPEAFAIAGQTMVGHVLGAGDPEAARSVSRRAVLWGLGTGLVMALCLVTLRPMYIPLFTPDLAVQELLWSLVVIVAGTQPVGAAVYVLDAILIAAGDGAYLAWSMLVAALVFASLAVVVLATSAGVVALW